MAGTGGRETGGVGGTGAEAVDGGETASGLAGNDGAGTCVEGAACRCGDLTGTLQCAEPGDGRCSCPPLEVCQTAPRECFEPCGGTPLGVWVLEKTCFNAASEGVGCAGTSVDAVGLADTLRLEILENEAIVAKGSEHLKVTARVPLACLGIESVERCESADFYASPFLYALSRPLPCAASACGHCECSAELEAYAGNGYSGFGKPWEPGSTTLSFGSMEVPYCVDGDTLWAGGVSADGTPKAAYQFRRRSCVGVPLPCTERSEAECAVAEDCAVGRCVALTASNAETCSGFVTSQDGCESTTGCNWETGGCWGSASKECDFRNCDQAPGCSWGPPRARCGGSPQSCYDRENEDCGDTPGCSVRTCHADGVDGSVPCAALAQSECSKASGCSWSGSSCGGVTGCSLQTDAAVCEALGCSPSPSPRCGGYPTVECSALGVDECATEPGCRLEW